MTARIPRRIVSRRLGAALAPAALALAAFVLAACTGTGGALPSTSAGASAASVPQATMDVANVAPCSLLTVAALGAVANATVTSQSLPDRDGYGICRFALNPALTAASIDLMISRTPAEVGQGEDFLGSLPQGASANELHGVGDGAWWGYCDICPAGTDTALTVIASPLRFTIALSGGQASAHQILGEALARAIIEAGGL